MIILPNVNLEYNISVYDDLIMYLSYRACGTIIGDLWLHADVWNCAGTACGGVFEGEIRSILAEHSISRFTPLAYSVGFSKKQNEY